MKGIVFTEFLEMVEEKFSFEIADAMVQQAQLPNGGAYTSVGTYDHREMARMVLVLSELTQIAAPTLIHAFGSHLFPRFVMLYPAFFTGIADAMDFLAGIEERIHTEVQKLYPDAQLPSFEINREGDEKMTMTYRSERCFGDLAHGLIDACVAHYGGGITVHRHEDAADQGRAVTFILQRMA